MKLQPVHEGGPAFTVKCASCRELIGDVAPNTRRPVIADLDGQPFHAYYCQACAKGMGYEEPRRDQSNGVRPVEDNA